MDDPAHYAYDAKIKAALWIGAPGASGLNALGRILTGAVDPSGRLVDTYARDFKLDPMWYNFGNYLAADGTPYSGWYAPAMNLHRNQFAGRNFEYYSEDGCLSGLMAAQVVTGASEKGVYTFMKHFALNDQETDRDTCNGLLTWANEQAMRETYFKPFELCVQTDKATAVMSSFNRIGTVWAGGDYRLLTELLRDEWGFRGDRKSVV